MKYLCEAPVRISLFGSGSDVGEYASKYGGVCINMAINIRQRFILGDDEKVDFGYLENTNPKFYEAFFKEIYRPNYFLQEFDGFIHSGLGTSASAAVCLVAGLSKLKGEKLIRYEIAEKAWDIEVNKLNLFGGKQDQFCATFGGFNLMKFNDRVEIQSIHREVEEKVTENLLLFDTRIRRKNPKLQENLKTISSGQKQALDIIKNLANDAYHRIYKGDIKGLGKLLDDTWRYKKQSNNVTTPEIDTIYYKARDLGAYGGKLCGSGGGGYMVFIVPMEKQEYFKNQIGLEWVDHGGIDWNGATTRFI